MKFLYVFLYLHFHFWQVLSRATPTFRLTLTMLIIILANIEKTSLRYAQYWLARILAYSHFPISLARDMIRHKYMYFPFSACTMSKCFPCVQIIGYQNILFLIILQLIKGRGSIRCRFYYFCPIWLIFILWVVDSFSRVLVPSSCQLKIWWNVL